MRGGVGRPLFCAGATIVQTICVNVGNICWPVRTRITINKYTKQQRQPQLKQQQQDNITTTITAAAAATTKRQQQQDKVSVRALLERSARSIKCSWVRQTMEPVLRRPLTYLSLSFSLSLSLSLPHDSLWKIDKCVPRFVCCTKNAKRRRQVRQLNPLATSPTIPMPLPPLSFLLLLLLLLRWIEFDLIMHKHISNYCYCYCNVYICMCVCRVCEYLIYVLVD